MLGILASVAVAFGLVIGGCAPEDLIPKYTIGYDSTWEVSTTAGANSEEAVAVVTSDGSIATVVDPQVALYPTSIDSAQHNQKCYVTQATNEGRSRWNTRLYSLNIKVRWCTDGVRVTGVEIRQIWGDGAWGWTYTGVVGQYQYYGNGFLESGCDGCYVVFVQGSFSVAGKGWFISATPTIELVFDSNDIYSPCGGPGGCPIVYDEYLG